MVEEGRLVAPIHIAGSVAERTLSDQQFGGQLAGRMPSDLEFAGSVAGQLSVEEPSVGCTPSDLEIVASLGVQIDGCTPSDPESVASVAGQLAAMPAGCRPFVLELAAGNWKDPPPAGLQIAERTTSALAQVGLKVEQEADGYRLPVRRVAGPSAEWVVADKQPVGHTAELSLAVAGQGTPWTRQRRNGLAPDPSVVAARSSPSDGRAVVAEEPTERKVELPSFGIGCKFVVAAVAGRRAILPERNTEQALLRIAVVGSAVVAAVA